MHTNYRRKTFSILSLTLLFIVTCTPCVDVQAASFDCFKAKSDLERAVCANEELSALDDSLADVYRDLLKDGQDAALLRSQQRAWLLKRMPDCQYQDKLASCLIDKYKSRVGLLKALKALRQPTKSPSSAIGPRYLLEEVSKKYDFVLQLLGECGPASGEEGGTCEAPGVVGVFHKGEKMPVQLIPMDNIFVSFTRREKPLTNSAALYDYQGVINVGDFNFDGQEDFAIQNGNHGSYSGPSYDVYLNARVGKGFQFNKDLSDLIESTLGLFQLDAEKKRLITFGKDGCCYHETTEYQVVNNKPVPVSRWIDEAKGDRNFTRKVRWVNGKWMRIADEFQHKSTGLVRLVPATQASQGEVNSEPPDVVNFPGREYESGAGWWALSCSSTCKVAPTRLTVSPEPFLFDDGSKVDGQHLQWSPDPDGALLFFKAPAKVLSPVARPITADPLGIDEGLLVGFSFAMPNGVKAYVMPMLILPNSKTSRSNGVPTLELRMNGQRQTLISGDFRPDDLFSYVPWAGDLDGDGKLDLILNSNPSSTCGVKIALFLSSQAKAGELVGNAGEFDSLQIDGKGCH